MARWQNTNWNLADRPTDATATIAVLMDIRDELQKLNRRMECWEIVEGFKSIRKHYLYTRRRFPLPKRPGKKKK